MSITLSNYLIMVIMVLYCWMRVGVREEGEEPLTFEVSH